MPRQSMYTDEQIHEMQKLRRWGIPITALTKYFGGTYQQIRYYVNIVEPKPLNEVLKRIEEVV